MVQVGVLSDGWGGSLLGLVAVPLLGLLALLGLDPRRAASVALPVLPLLAHLLPHFVLLFVLLGLLELLTAAVVVDARRGWRGGDH